MWERERAFVRVGRCGGWCGSKRYRCQMRCTQPQPTIHQVRQSLHWKNYEYWHLQHIAALNTRTRGDACVLHITLLSSPCASLWVEIFFSLVWSLGYSWVDWQGPPPSHCRRHHPHPSHLPHAQAHGHSNIPTVLNIVHLSDQSVSKCWHEPEVGSAQIIIFQNDQYAHNLLIFYAWVGRMVKSYISNLSDIRSAVRDV